MSVLLSGPRLPPASSGSPGQLVVLCHGYGADGNDLIGLGSHWRQLMPDTVFVAPNAPERCAMSAAGYQWFSITRMDPGETEKGVSAAAPLLDAFIRAELARYRLGPDRLALVGFSQGTMMALHVGLTGGFTPAAIVGFSGALAGSGRLAENLTARPPVMLIHGEADDMIPPSAMYSAAQTMGGAGLSVQWHISRGVGHGIDPEGLALAGRFLTDAFAGRLDGAAAGQAIQNRI